ncbi:hypothetical protein CDV55_103641 [Aspergillus turcosus]|nr:hypothetical protein CDV55_103641 [Aspergillus turcosus]
MGLVHFNYEHRWSLDPAKDNTHQFSGFETIGKVFFILDVVLFLSLMVGISIRFITTPTALETSLLHPTEGLFFPCFLLSTSTIISEAALYGISSTGPWLPRALHAVFWVYLCIATLSAIIQFFVLFAGENLPLQSMTPAWVLPIFPAMLVGSLASTLAPSLPADQRIPVLVAGVTCQGLGLTIALLLYPLYFGRLMRYGLPAPAMRPGMFIPVGQMGYTAVALVSISRSIPEGYGYFAANPGAVGSSRMLALWVAIWLWMLGFWFFSVSFIATVTWAASKSFDFNLTWWASVFPNIGWTLATIEIGRELESDGVLWVSSAMTVLLAVVWCLVFAAHARAVFQKKILYRVRD